MSVARAKSEALAVLDRVGLAHRARLPAGQLGLLDMKQLELAKALALRPKLLLLDEIAGGLTDAECDVLLETIRAVHKSGVTVVWIEHVIHALRRVVTRLAVLAGGNFIAMGTPRRLVRSARQRGLSRDVMRP